MPDSRPAVNLTRQHKALAEFQVGEYKAIERVYLTPNSEPLERVGKASYRLLLDGLAGLLETQLQNPDGSPYQSFTLATWNVSKAQYDGIFMDIHSFDGFDPMNGSLVKSLGDTRELRQDIAAKRTWSGSITMPRFAPSLSGDKSRSQLTGVDRLPVQLIENRLSEDEWVLIGMMLDDNGDEFVGLEWTFTRQE